MQADFCQQPAAVFEERDLRTLVYDLNDGDVTDGGLTDGNRSHGNLSGGR